MNKKDFLFLLNSFLIWRIGLFFILYLATRFVPLQNNFLGGGMSNYLSNPYLWGWINFDGEHFLSIAQTGYQNLTYFFFPVFPILTKFLAELFSHNLVTYAVSGLVVSNISFFLSILGLWRLIRLDYDRDIAKIVIVLLLLFPTSFYFVSFYSESLFLALFVWSFYFARKNNWVLAGILGILVSATRVIGIIILPILLVEYFLSNKNFKKSILNWKILFAILSPLGLIAYMYYLWDVTGDPLNFLNTVGIFGPQRSSDLVLLPQVFYRYIFKVIPNLNFSLDAILSFNYFSVFFTTLLEFVTGVLLLVFSIVGVFKLRLSYSIYLILGYLIPALSGSFSSLPRYAVVLFPMFILFSLWLRKVSAPLKIVIYGLLFVGLVISTSLFLRGFWIS